jgi:hypothetical protein
MTRSPTDSRIIETVELADLERESGRENFDFYCFLIWPTIESFWLAAVSLMMLTRPLGQTSEVWLDAKAVVDKAQLLGKTLYHQGDLSYFEAVNKQTLQNAYGRFEEEGIIVKASKTGVGKEASKAVAALKLADEWMPQRNGEGQIQAKGKLWDFTETISQTRREGKNRRDGATVRTRVLRLVDWAGAELFVASPSLDPAAKDAVAVAPSADQDSSSEQSKRRKRKHIKPVSRL